MLADIESQTDKTAIASSPQARVQVISTYLASFRT